MLCSAHSECCQPPDLHLKLVHAIERHRSLYFVGGDALSPNFDSSVFNAAIAALGTDVMVATINLDTFRAKFITEDQAKDVLGPTFVPQAKSR